MTTQRRRRPGELAFGLALLVFSALALWQARGISGFDSLSGAGVFPMLAAGTMVVSALVALLQGARRPRSTEGGEAASFAETILPVRLVLFVALIALYMVALPYLGFLVASFLFLWAGFWFLHRGGLAMPLLLAAGSLAVIYVLFRYVFSVILPKGVLF
ncbi:tripartite tricarboxylate transporter TctB family protein [Lutibaculum baratangense]|uniref:Tricarboxylate transport protein TctB n=1 Tax=Lutibaculum baratangense AMV1 TaxID=631454 RepID=V4R508_9HYPH|nr:tripartite tricarboxylate transporter TctB family protein [Lutibaculum baratangense]ESR27037.1 Tricarboxylate transport protein TctB [Lutibaculum baratangense AMV1]